MSNFFVKFTFRASIFCPLIIFLICSIYFVSSSFNGGLYKIGVAGTNSAMTASKLLANDTRMPNITMLKWKNNPEQKWMIISQNKNYKNVMTNTSSVLILNQGIPVNFISTINATNFGSPTNNNKNHQVIHRKWILHKIQENTWTIGNNDSECLCRTAKRVPQDLVRCAIINVNQHWTLTKLEADGNTE